MTQNTEHTEPDHDKAINLLREVVASGVSFIDTADVYGPHSIGQLIREALHPYPDNLVIATKGGFLRGGPEYTDIRQPRSTGTSRPSGSVAWTPLRRPRTGTRAPGMFATCSPPNDRGTHRRGGRS